jgi:RNA polymerase sigma-70 factor (ECF subfamily)
MSEDVLELQMLIRAAQKGDEAAFEALLTRYQTPVFRCVYAMLRNRTDAEDVTQEVFIKLWRTLPRYRFESAFLTYLLRIAKNAARDHLRAAKRRISALELTVESDDGELDELPIADTAPESRPDMAYLAAEKQQMLHHALLALDLPLRQVIVLRAQEGMSYQEIANVLDISEGTVKSRLNRAKNKLIKILENGNFFE